MIPHADSLVGSPPLPLRLYIAAALGKYQHGPEVNLDDLVLAHEEGP